MTLLQKNLCKSSWLFLLFASLKLPQRGILLAHLFMFSVVPQPLSPLNGPKLSATAASCATPPPPPHDVNHIHFPRNLHRLRRYTRKHIHTSHIHTDKHSHTYTHIEIHTHIYIYTAVTTILHDNQKNLGGESFWLLSV